MKTKTKPVIKVVETKPRSLSEIASEIWLDWGSLSINYAARPYLDAMKQLDTINDAYGADDARSIVAYFLSNAATWRGEVARRVKKELNIMLEKVHG